MSKPNLDTITPKPGERLLLVGMTGSGKSVVAIKLLQNLDDPPVIYDTKIEPKFDKLTKTREVHSPEELNELFHNNIDVNDAGEHSTLYDYFIVRPEAKELLDPMAMDEKWLWNHYQHLHGAPAYIDELAEWHKNSQAGVGLRALLQRGRSKGIAVIMSTQRPKFISRSCLTEADRVIVMKMADRDERKRFQDIIPDFNKDERLDKYHFRHYQQGDDESQLFLPFPLDVKFNSGYTDNLKAAIVPIADAVEDLVIDWF